MPLSHLRTDAINENHLLGLIEDKVREGTTIDYKINTYQRTDDGRADFLADLTAFANTRGGYLVLGMEERGGFPIALCGMSGIANADAEMLRLHQIAQRGIEPRLVGLNMHPIPLKTGSHAIVVHIASGSYPPYRVKAEGKRRHLFYARNDSGNYEPDVDQLRELFSMQNSTQDRIREFVNTNLAKVSLDPTRGLRDDFPGILTMHIVPFSATTYSGHRVSAAQLSSQDILLRPMRTSEGWNSAMNILGFRSATSVNTREIAHTQSYRNGSLEFVSHGYIDNREPSRGPILWSDLFEGNITVSAFQGLTALGNLKFNPPYAVLVTLFNAADAYVGLGSRPLYRVPLGRNRIDFDDVSIEEVPRDIQQTAAALRPIFDQLANAGNAARSVHFTSDGMWNLEKA